MTDEPRIERIIAMAERLIAALEADIAALKAGTPSAMRSTDPDIQRLSALYGREVQTLDPGIARSARADLRAKFIAVTAKIREVLALHARMLTRVRNASEGMIRAIAEEVDRMKAPMRTYGPAASQARGGSAMIHNSVV